jgi:hypothetical protein
MKKEKIITIYPTVIKDGVAISHYMPPDPVMFKNNSLQRVLFISLR